MTATYSRDPGESVTGGPYHITATLSPTGVLSNYNITNNGANFTIQPKGLDITASSRTKTYGDTVTFAGTEFTTGAGQLVNGDMVTSMTLTSPGAAATATVAGSPYTITASAAVFAPAGAGSNYAITYHIGSLTVNAAQLDITASDESKTYGDTFTPNGATQFTTGVGQLKNGDAVASVTLTSSGYAASAGVAGSPYTITASAAVFTPMGASANYSITYHTGSFTVNAAQLDITATDESKTYGDTFTPNGATQFSTGTGQLKNGDAVSSVTLSSSGYAASAGVAGSPYTITASAAVFTPMGASTNYSITYHTGSFTVNAAQLDITASDESKTYGDTFTPNGATQFTTGMGQLKNGDAVSSVTLTSSGYAASAGVAGSPYTITASAAMFTPMGASANYSITYHTGHLTVNAAQLDVTATDESKTYGDTFTPNGATQFSTGTGQLKNGDAVSSVTLTSSGYAASAGVAGSPYTITASAAVFAPAGAGTNYSITYHIGHFAVNAAPLDITATDESKTYGDTFTPNGATQFSTGTGQLKNGDAVSSVTLTSSGYAATAGVAGSPYTITASAAMFTPMGASTNYSITYHTGTLTVDPATLNITANNQSKTYGDTFTFAGTEFTTGAGELKNGDTVTSATLTSAGAAATATVTAPGPNYTINISAAVFAPAGAGGNYSVSYHTATLHIDPATLNITANNQSKTYGDTFSFAGTEFSTGAGELKNGDTLTSATLTSAGAAATATVTAPGPNYAINISAAMFAPMGAGGNYSIIYHTGTLHIDPAALDITSNNQSKTYGDTFSFAGTEFTAGMGQLKNGDTVSSVTLTSAGAAATATVTAPGPNYTINIGAAVFAPMGAGGNYSITYHTGTLTVNPAALDITATDESKTYGDTFTPNGATQFSTGMGQLKNGDAVASVTLTSSGYAASAGVVGSPYTITPSAAVFTQMGAGGNYSITYHNGSFTVNPAALEITATGESKTYGDSFTPNPATQFSTGMGQLKNGDAVSSVTLTSSGYAASAGVAGSPYTITPSAAVFTPMGAGTNYSITYHNGSFTVNPAALDITANNQSKTYGNTFTFTGTEFSTGMGQLKNGDTVTSVSLSSAGTAATATVAGSPYTISASAAVFSPAGAGTNYSIAYHNGSFTVNPAPLDITANNQSKTYGGTFTFAGTEFTVGVGQLKNGDTVNSVTLTSAGAAATATVTAPGPNYAINASAAVFSPAGAGGNYSVVYHNGTLHINPASLDITANNQSKTYGNTFTFAGTEFTTGAGQLKNGDSVSSVTFTSAGAAATATVSAPGPTYAINASAAVFTPAGAGGNYSITYHSGTLTVTVRQLDITANNRSKTYGATVTFAGIEFTTGAGQLVNGDSVTSVTLSSAGAAATATVTAPGPTYTINISAAVFSPAGKGGNYSVTYHTGTLTVNPATLTITATNRTKVFGATYTPNTTPPSVDFNVTGLLNSDTVTSITLTCSGYPSSALPTPSGYTITPSAAMGTGLGNYTIGYVNGTLTIGYNTCSGPNPGGVILQPINADGTSIFPHAGRTVPVKFTVCDANGNPISNPSAVFAGTGGALTMLSAVRGQIPNPDENQYNDIPDVAFRYTGGMWMFNMATSNLQSGYSYMFRINLANGQGITFVIAIK